MKTDVGIAQIKALPIPPVAVSGSSQVHGTNVEIKHDIFGFAGRTQFFIVLDQLVDIDDPTWKTALCEQDHAILATALQAVNRLLAVYRDRDKNQIGIRSFHVIELVREDLSDIHLVVVDSDLCQIPEFAVVWPGYRSMGFGSAVNRNSDVVAEIRTYLASNTPIPIERELLTSARNHLWRRQLRLVPIEANTAFESFAFSSLRRFDPTTIVPDSSDIYVKLQALEEAFTLAASAKSKIFAPWFDRSVPGWKGLLNPELRQWHRTCYDLRNKLIHRGYNAVQYAEASDALQFTVAAMDSMETSIAQLSP